MAEYNKNKMIFFFQNQLNAMCNTTHASNIQKYYQSINTVKLLINIADENMNQIKIKSKVYTKDN